MNETGCNTCFSLGRKLKPINHQVKYLFELLCPEMFLNNLQHAICWECEFMINRIKLFQGRLFTANHTIKMYIKGKKTVYDFKGLSRLKMSEVIIVSTKEQSTPTLPQDKLTLPQNTLTPPDNTLTLPQNTPRLLHITPELPHNTLTLPHNTLTLSQNTLTLPQNTLTLPHNTLTLPHNTLTLPQNKLTLPHNTLTLPQNTLTLPQKKPLPSLKEAVAAPLRQDTEPVTIKMEEEDEGSCLDGDYDELIQPSTIQPLSKDPLMVPAQNKRINIELVTHESIKEGIATPNVIKYIPQKVFINTPKVNVPLRGVREPVKVTGSAPKLITSKEINPNKIKTEEKSGFSVPAPAEDTVFNLNIDKLLPKLLEAPSKPQEFLSLKHLVPNSLRAPKETYSIEGRTDDSDVAKCIILNRAEVTAFRETKRSNSAYVTAQFKCEKCIEWYHSQDKLDEHNKKHDKSQGSSICEFCEQRFADERTLNEHYKVHFIVYRCVRCPYENSDRLKVSGHNRKNHEESTFSCIHCDAEFKTFRERFRHMRKDHSKKIKCKECGKLLSNHQMRIHMINVHREEKVPCSICKKKVRKYNLKNHLKLHDEQKDIIAYCADCGTYFKNNEGYKLHLKKSIKHNSIEKLGNKCDHCNQYFANKEALKIHVDQIFGVKYTCDLCEKDFKSKRTLISHIQAKHEGKKPKVNEPIMCEICGKSFTVRKSLNEHLDRHLGHRNHVCAECGATFIYKAALFTHRRYRHSDKIKTKDTKNKLQ